MQHWDKLLSLLQVAGIVIINIKVIAVQHWQNAITGTKPFIRISEIRLFLKITPCACAAAVQYRYSMCTGTLRILNRLIKVKRTLPYKYINLYVKDCFVIYFSQFILYVKYYI